jgi:dienelactone hydrolase
MRRTAAALLLSLIAATVPAAAGALAPEQVPDRVAVLSEPQRRGAVEVVERERTAPVPRWSAPGTGIAGTSVLSGGEHVYSDFVLDAHGADDGGDAARLAVIDPLRDAESRLDRLDALQQAAGDQFDAPEPVGTPDRYGDEDLNGVADLVEARWAVEGRDLLLQVRLNQLTDEVAPSLAVQVVLDGGVPQTVTPADGGSLRSRPLDHVLRARFPGAADGREAVVVSVVTGVLRDGAFVPANAAYRSDEPVTIYGERRQALAFGAGDVHAFTTTLDLGAMRAGASDRWRLGPGYHERVFRSADAISSDTRAEQGAWQPYGLYVPAAADEAGAVPLTVWLHYRGGKAHSGAAWTPRLITQLGEEVGSVVVTPRGRGTSTWYVTEGHQDVLEVLADVEGTLGGLRMPQVDPARRYVSGYSMGGYGTWLFAGLYPDLFAGGFTQSGALTQGAWTGVGPDGCPDPRLCYVEANGGDAEAQLTFRLVDNLRHVPIAIHHGTDDELVPVTGIGRMVARLTELGYRHEALLFDGYEHYTQAIVDEWRAGAAYLSRFRAPHAPATVTYRVVPRLVEAVNTVTADGVTFDFRPDGAYWVDDIVVADGAGPDGGVVTVTSGALQPVDDTPVALAVPFDPTGHTAAFQTARLDWLDAVGLAGQELRGAPVAFTPANALRGRRRR